MEQWIFGDYISEFNDSGVNYTHGIKEKGYYPVTVVPESVGQFTGLTDKNGIKIFEGDCDNIGHIVVFEKGMFLIKDANGFNRFLCEFASAIEIIGSAYQNPELLEVSK